MRRFHKMILFSMALALVTGGAYSTGWAWDKWEEKDPITDQWNAADLLVARPLGVAAAILGTGLFTVSLPFTVTADIFSRFGGGPSSAVRESAKMFMLDPLKFSFAREFPDENM